MIRGRKDVILKYNYAIIFFFLNNLILIILLKEMASLNIY